MDNFKNTDPAVLPKPKIKPERQAPPKIKPNKDDPWTFPSPKVNPTPKAINFKKK